VQRDDRRRDHRDHDGGARFGSGFLPKWIAWLSFPVALTMLVAFFFIPFLIMLGWILVVSVTFMVRKEAPKTAAA
jgi:hypothetical protein